MDDSMGSKSLGSPQGIAMVFGRDLTDMKPLKHLDARIHAALYYKASIGNGNVKYKAICDEERLLIDKLIAVVTEF